MAETVGAEPNISAVVQNGTMPVQRTFNNSVESCGEAASVGESVASVSSRASARSTRSKMGPTSGWIARQKLAVGFTSLVFCGTYWWVQSTWHRKWLSKSPPVEFGVYRH